LSRDRRHHDRPMRRHGRSRCRRPGVSCHLCRRCLRRPHPRAARDRAQRLRRLLLGNRYRHGRCPLQCIGEPPMTSSVESLVAVVTTDLAAVTRGRFVAESRLEQIAATGVGWVPANLSLTPFNSITDPNPWGSSGDLRLLPDIGARFRTTRTGSPTPFDMVPGDIVELDGSPWVGCTRTLLRQALTELKATTGLSMLAAFEQ